MMESKMKIKFFNIQKDPDYWWKYAPQKSRSTPHEIVYPGINLLAVALLTLPYNIYAEGNIWNANAWKKTCKLLGPYGSIVDFNYILSDMHAMLPGLPCG